MSVSTSSSDSPRLGLWHWVAFTVGVVPLAVYAFSPREGDLPLYFRTAHAFLQGAIPNQDFRFEYPPYALLWFVPAAWLGPTLPSFIPIFGLQLALFDAFIKWLLLSEGVKRWGRSPRAWVPFAVYTVASWVQSIHYLKRYDLIPAAFVLVALMALARRRDALAGWALSVGVVTKLYPVVLVPLALAVCWRRGTWRRLVLGLVAGALPLVPLSVFWPWWNFAAFHVERGLQVESLGASLLWAAHRLGLVPEVAWVHAPAAYELHGAAAEAVNRATRWVWVVGSLAAAAVGLRSLRQRMPERPEEWARLALGPLIAFVVLNPVLSPQYLVWLVGAAGLALLSGSRWAPVALFVAAMISRGLFTGSSSYGKGLTGPFTVLLLVRNGLLLAAGFALVREAWRLQKSGPEEALRPQALGSPAARQAKPEPLPPCP
ncbi:glycosyltransferase family 87 protein [Stigmatella sp. ncwal1]|uniref:Glycosyltransferase family 87 protein n=1 Tax=Stigmatella ashevillensis TaxID=2995309 RepID=A0ABT5DJA9_9BACT|nr:glycosyltransferase family 87 protein [Stigmatella ashevillena]MDC0713741.1 glycosyltransferase family 87 protein [Stigmatella ashevillena]